MAIPLCGYGEYDTHVCHGWQICETARAEVSYAQVSQFRAIIHATIVMATPVLDKGPRSSVQIANEFLDIAMSQGEILRPLKLLKLTYIAHGWHLAFTGKPLINDRIEAWKFGPVMPPLYRQLRHVRGGGIESLLGSDSDRLTQEESDLIRPFLRGVWDTYGKLNGLTLSDLTHLPGTPWFEAYHRPKKGRNPIIRDEEIQAHYLDIMKSDLNGEA